MKWIFLSLFTISNIGLATQQENINPSPTTSILIAKKEKKTKKKSKTITTDDAANTSEHTSSSKSPPFKGIQLGAGILSGLKTEGASGGLVFTGDYKSPIGEKLNWQLGALLWRYDVGQELYAASATMTSFGGGVGFTIPLGQKMWLEGAAHLYYAILTLESSADVLGETVTASDSYSGLGTSIHGSFHIRFGSFNIGPEIRIPINLSSDIGDRSGNYLLFSLGWQF